MPASLFQFSTRKISQITFEWQAADKASLLAGFMLLEVFSHWLWGFLVCYRQAKFADYVNLSLLCPLWIIMSVAALFFMCMAVHLSRLKNNEKILYRWQAVLVVFYTAYIAIVIGMMGYTSLVAGVSLVGGAMLGMMLIKRRYVWRIFLLHIGWILLVVMLPYFGVSFPSLRQITIAYPLLDTYQHLTYNEISMIESAVATAMSENEVLSMHGIQEVQRSSAFFWRSTHLYLALPKAIFMVYAFQRLLQILDDSKKEILHHAHHDPLTGLKNRRSGLTQMHNQISNSKPDQDYSVILMDLDLFKNINDQYGHNVGDKVLCEVAQVLLSTLTEDTIISRYGGEEFLIVLPNTPHHNAMMIAEQLRKYIAKLMIQIDANIGFKVTASFGLYTLTYSELMRMRASQRVQKLPAKPKITFIKSLTNHQKVSPTASLFSVQFSCDICQRLISIADKALYQAKDQGRNQVVSANEWLEKGMMSVPRSVA